MNESIGGLEWQLTMAQRKDGSNTAVMSSHLSWRIVRLLVMASLQKWEHQAATATLMPLKHSLINPTALE
jgi:hypothetical protein